VPELPEVETVRLGLVRQTSGIAIDRVQVLRNRAIAAPSDPELFCLALQGCTIITWRRRGKYLLAPLSLPDGSDGGIWGVHLRMTGQFLWVEPPQESSAAEASAAQASSTSPAEPHTRVRFWCLGGAELRFIDTRSFAQMWWVPPGKPVDSVITGLARLGPEPFDAGFNPGYLQQRLARSIRPIKNALLDQSLVAGVGNIYADESLFQAGIRPQTPSRQLGASSLKRLHAALVEVLTTSIGAGGTSFSDFRDLTGSNGNYGGQAWVYRRAGSPCRRCGASIERTRLAGRSSHWCPRCQT